MCTPLHSEHNQRIRVSAGGNISIVHVRSARLFHAAMARSLGMMPTCAQQSWHWTI
jgi:hypothetical protein